MGIAYGKPASNELGRAIAAMLGLEPKQVKSIDICLRGGAAAEMEIVYYLSSAEVSQITEMVKRFEIVAVSPDYSIDDTDGIIIR